MSKYDDIRQSMGMQPSGTSSTGGPKKPSKYDDLRMEMKLIPDTRPQKLPLNPQQQHSLDVEQSDQSQMNQAQQTAEDMSKGPPPQDNSFMGQLKNAGHEFLDAAYAPVKATGQFVDRLSKAFAASVTPTGPNFGKSDSPFSPVYTNGPTAHDEAVQRLNQADLGNNFANKSADFLGGTLGYVANPAFMGIPGGGVGNFFDNPLVQRAAGAAGNKAQSLLPSAGLTISKDGTQIVDSLLGKTLNKGVQGAVTGGLGATAYAPFQTMTTSNNLGDIPRNVLDQGLQGAAFGGAIGGASPALGAALGRMFSKPGELTPPFDQAAQSRNVEFGTPTVDNGSKFAKQFSGTPDINTQTPLKVGETAIPTAADGTHLSQPQKIVDVQSKNGVNYYKFEDTNYLPENQVARPAQEPNEQVMNITAKEPQPIKLTPQEIAKNERIDQFNRLEPNPTIPDTMGQIGTKTKREPVGLGARANEAYIKTVDDVHRIHQFDDAVERVTGSLDPTESAYKLALNSRGSDMISRQILEKNMVDSEGNVVGQSLKDIAKQIPKDQYNAFEDYLIAKHAATRMGRGEKVYKDDLNMTVQKAQLKADNYEKTNPGFKKIAEQYYEYNQQLGQKWLVDTGILSQEQWDGYLKANPHYVPNQRVFSEIEKQNQFVGKKGFANQPMPVKKGIGSQKEIVSPFESTIENTAKYVKTAKQNEVMQTLYKNILKDPEAFKSWAEIVDEGKGNAGKILHEHGPEGLLDEVSQSFEKKKPDLTKGNIVSAFVDGERVHLKINDPQLLEALTNLSPQAQPKWIEVIGKVTKTMKVLTTGFNPIFSLTRNIWRDMPHSFVSSTSRHNPVLFGKDLIGAFVDVMGNREAYQSYKNIGGGHSSSVAADRNLLAQSKEKILPSQGLGQSLKRTLITKPFHKLENFNNAIETAPRLAEFKRITKEGDYNSKIDALYKANDLTVNFNKHGTYTKQLDALIPYLNASVQGLDQFGRMFKNNPIGTSTKAFAAITIPTAILYAVNHNDPNYQQMSNFIKDNNFLIPKGDGTFWKIPKPRELGMIFSSGIERAMREWKDQDPNAFQDFAKNLIQNFAPPGVGGAIQGIQQSGPLGAIPGAMQDTIGGPMISLLTNKDFAGRSIVPGDLQKLSPRLQYDAKTSELSKMLGGSLNISPKQLDYLVKSYGGVIGQLGLPATTKGNSIMDTLKQQVTADPVYSNDISRNFFDAKTKADMAQADAKHTMTAPDNPGQAKFLDSVSNNLSRLRTQMKLVQNDPNTSKLDKQAKLRDMQIQMNQLEQQATKTIAK